MPRKKTHANRVYQFLGEPGPGTLVAGYVRYSSELQDPVSILTQKRRIEEFAAIPFDKLSAGLTQSDFAVKEWVGLLSYWLSGRSRALFPAPQPK